MIREERDPAFWEKIAEHPKVQRGTLLGSNVSLAQIIGNSGVKPLAAEHGGYLFVRLDGVGMVWELHSLFEPKGWGREAMTAAVEAFNSMFSGTMQVLTTYEVAGNPHSRPPKGFGFVPAGGFCPAMGHSLRSWVLTRQSWLDRPSKFGVN